MILVMFFLHRKLSFDENNNSFGTILIKSGLKKYLETNISTSL